MKALTVRNLPTEVADAVQQRAHEHQLSFSKALVAMLQEHLAENKTPAKKKRDLSWIAGTMSEKDAQAFDQSLKEQRRIDPEMWK